MSENVEVTVGRDTNEMKDSECNKKCGRVFLLIKQMLSSFRIESFEFNWSGKINEV